MQFLQPVHLADGKPSPGENGGQITLAAVLRGELDGNAALTRFGEPPEEAALRTIPSGVVTGGLAVLTEPKPAAA